MIKNIQKQLRSINYFDVSLAFVAMAVIALIFWPTVPTKAETPIREVELEQPIEPSLTKDDKRQIQCMATNLYFEARGESEKGMIAVNNVVLNRVQDRRFPDTPCGVIYQRTRRVCQFSWYCDGKSDYPANRQLYAKLENIAEEMYIEEESKDLTNGALFYHAHYVSPNWKRMKRTAKIGAHIFYRG